MIKQPSQRDCSIYDFVVHQNKTISDTARMFGVSPSTVRRAIDKYTEWKIQRDINPAA